MPKRRDTLELLDEDARLFDVVLGRITEDGGKPNEVCGGMGLSWGALLAWVNRDEMRVNRFKDALEVRGHLLAEEAIEIADGADDVGKANLQVNTRKWMAARLNPGWYGDKVKHEHEIEVKDDAGLLGKAVELLGKVKEIRERQVIPAPKVVELSVSEFEEI